MGGAGFEPAKAVPPDLQSGPFGRLGIHPFSGFAVDSPSPQEDKAGPCGDRRPSRAAELAVRLELTTYGLQNRCSAG